MFALDSSLQPCDKKSSQFELLTGYTVINVPSTQTAPFDTFVCLFVSSPKIDAKLAPLKYMLKETKKKKEEQADKLHIQTMLTLFFEVHLHLREIRLQ